MVAIVGVLVALGGAMQLGLVSQNFGDEAVNCLGCVSTNTALAIAPTPKLILATPVPTVNPNAITAHAPAPNQEPAVWWPGWPYAGWQMLGADGYLRLRTGAAWEYFGGPFKSTIAATDSAEYVLGNDNAI